MISVLLRSAIYELLAVCVECNKSLWKGHLTQSEGGCISFLLLQQIAMNLIAQNKAYLFYLVIP